MQKNLPSAKFSIHTTVKLPQGKAFSSVRKKLPTIHQAILGKNHTLSLVFIGPQRALTLNKTYRKKQYVPNVLSFPLEETHGEIFITPQIAKRECKQWNISFETYIGYLFIHALLHLKGYAHGDTMDKAEKTYLKRFFSHSL